MSYELTARELTKLWRAPYAERMAHVRALLEAARAAPLLGPRLEAAAQTIRGLPEALLPEDRHIVVVAHTRSGAPVWVRGPADGCADGVVRELHAKVRFEGVPGLNPDGPTVIDLEEYLPDWQEYCEFAGPPSVDR